MGQVVVSSEELTEFDERMAMMEVAHAQWATSASMYYWNLWEIYSRELWRARYDNMKEWLGTLSTESWGFSISHYQEVFADIKRWQAIKCSDDDVKTLLGRRNMAVSHDLKKQMFERVGKDQYAITETARKRIEEAGETPRDFVMRVASLGAGEGRREVTQKANREWIFFRANDVEYIPDKGMMLATVVHETEEDGIVFEGTVTIMCRQTKPRKTGELKLPRKVAEVIGAKLGVIL